MSDQNENPQGTGEQPTPPETQPTPPASPYLERAKMLPIEGIVYCLEHTTVHDDTTNPYGEGQESWCDVKEHRTVYYRGRKGDLDESDPPRRRVRPAVQADDLTSDERVLVTMLVDRERVKAENAFAELREIIGVGDLAGCDELLGLLVSAGHKLNGDDEPDD